MTEKDMAIHFCIGMLEGISAPNLENWSKTIALGIKGIRELVALRDTLKEKPVSEGLEKEMNDFFLTMQVQDKEYINEDTFRSIARHFVDWQKEQLMAKAIDVEVKVDAGGYPYIPQIELYDYVKDIPLAREGEKYKVVLMKEDSGVADRQKKFFRHHRGGFEDSMRTMVEVSGLDDIRRIVAETSIFKDYYKNIRISGEGVRDERCIPYGWGDTVYFVVADFDGYTGQCIGWTNFKDE